MKKRANTTAKPQACRRRLDQLVRLRKYRPAAEAGDGGSWHVGHNPTGFDGTLCGIADEGFGGSCDVAYDEKDGNVDAVTCEQCLAIIDYCASLKPNPKCTGPEGNNGL